MKKIQLLFLLLSCSWSIANAQFELTAKGFVNKEDPEKDFVVLNVDGKSKADLFKSTLVYLNKIYPNAKNNVSSVEGESISVSGMDDSVISSVFNKYGFNFEFKDGKIKVSSSYSLFYYSSVNGIREEYEIYSNKGKLKREKDKLRLENFYNGFIDLIKKNAEKKSEDW